MKRKQRKVRSRKPKQNITRRNHYVAEWCQRRFMKEGQTIYWYLDKTPDKLPSGEGYYNSEHYYSAKQCFQQRDLYTIELLGQKSDIIERELFGDIDNKASRAISILDDKDAWKVKNCKHKLQDFMAYMNAQKLRTPKGLDWIKNLILVSSGYDFRYTRKDIVLGYMQSTRQAYCSMWTEAIWEVVSAVKSEIKFIVTDNPVTFYNYYFSPGSKYNDYPEEPLLHMIGTQTLCPLSLNLCLILTHRQLAIDPSGADPSQSRINARYYDRAIFKFDSIIFGRELSDIDVCKTNYILKQQAKRYIAGARKEWLHPENNISEEIDWKELCHILLPERDKIMHTTGFFFGHRDGTIEGYDPYGQEIKDPKELNGLKKSMLIVKKHTRKEKFSEDLTALLNKYDEPNIEEQNKILIEGIWDIFGLSKNNSLNELRDNFSSEQVCQFYRLIEDLWPAGFDIFRRLKKDDGFNIIYSGEIDYQVISLKLLSLGIYFDKIYIVNPFPNPCCMRNEYNPLANPNQYLATTYELLLFMITMQPWVDTNQVQIIPSPFDNDFAFRKRALENIEKRKNNLQPDFDEDLIRSQIVKQYERMLCMVPNGNLENSIKRLIPTLPENYTKTLAQYIRKIKQDDPTRWRQSLVETGPQLHIIKNCENMETVLYLSEITKAVPYTYIKFKIDELEGVNTLGSNTRSYELPLLRYPDAYLVKALKEVGVLQNIRELLQKSRNNIDQREKLFHDLEEAIKLSKSEWGVIFNVIRETNKKSNFQIEDVVFNRQITIHSGKYNLPFISEHIRKTYGENRQSEINMFLST